MTQARAELASLNADALDVETLDDAELDQVAGGSCGANHDCTLLSNNVAP